MWRAISFLGVFLLSQLAIGQTSFMDVSSSTGFVPSHPSDAHGSGVAAADYDNDGDIDIYLCTARGEPDHLYKNTGGSFEEVGLSVGLGSLQRSRMALWLDYDGDGMLDLLVAGDCDLDTESCPNINNLRLFKQDEGSFIEVTNEAGLSGFGPHNNDQTFGGLSAQDINFDGFVDFVQVTRKGPITLFLNNGNGSFSNITEESHLTLNDSFYYQPFIIDINEDGFLDIYCNVDFGPNQLWLNKGDNTFNEVALQVKCASSFNEMGLAVGDFDNDQDFDFYSTNIYNYSGGDFHNVLLQNNLSQGEFRFEEVAKQFSVHEGGWGWGATFIDMDNDGWLDLAETNGWDIRYDEIDQSKLWHNTGYTFEDVSAVVGFDDELNGASLIGFDYDRDGDVDLIQTVKGNSATEIPVRLLENQLISDGSNNYLVIKPRMEGYNRFAIGAVVKARIGDSYMTRLIHAGISFYGHEPAEAFFGLGSATNVDELTIIWPGGAVSRWQNVNANQIIELFDVDVVHEPSGFKASIIAGAVELSWNDYSTNETGYLLQRSITHNFSEKIEINLPANTNSYLDEDIQGNPEYYYRLKAYNQSIESEFTQPLFVDQIISGLHVFSEASIYPNPVEVGSNILIKGINWNARVKLFDVFGRSVSFEKYNLGNGIISIHINTAKLGMYILEFDDIQKKIVMK